jgi:hypothetical protein
MRASDFSIGFFLFFILVLSSQSTCGNPRVDRPVRRLHSISRLLFPLRADGPETLTIAQSGRRVRRRFPPYAVLYFTSVHRSINMQDEKPRSNPARSGITAQYNTVNSCFLARVSCDLWYYESENICAIWVRPKAALRYLFLVRSSLVIFLWSFAPVGKVPGTFCTGTFCTPFPSPDANVSA